MDAYGIGSDWKRGAPATVFATVLKCAREKIGQVIDSTGRGGGIRTPDPLLPKQMRYQTALRPDDAPIVSRKAFGPANNVAIG